MRVLSKSKIMSYLQCPKRLWLEIHSQEPLEIAPAIQATFDIGKQVGVVARQVYDPKNKGIEFDPMSQGVDTVIKETQTLLQFNQALFEAGFSANGVRAFADVLLPIRRGGKKVWHMIEVKSASELKDYYRDDVAIQSYAARSSGAPLHSVSLAYINKNFVYAGDGDYTELFTEIDLTEEACSRDAEVEQWIAAAQKVVKKRTEPAITTGKHCSYPNPCVFVDHCSAQESQAKFPVQWLPNVSTKVLKDYLDSGITDLRKVPDNLLNPLQLRVKKHSISNQLYFDQVGAAEYLAQFKLPAYFLDFETISLAVPVWKKRRPYRQIPFQFSLHKVSRNGELTHQDFLDLTGKDPAKQLAESLIEACGARGVIFAYKASFEKMCICEMAEFLPKYKDQLLAINDRIVDLLEVAKKYYYHPEQHGSWSIKQVLPLIAPDLSYQDLIGIQNGGAAMQAYLEAISAGTSTQRKHDIDQNLRRYCELDTLAMVRIWQYFCGHQQ